MHLEDTAGVMKKLLNEFVSESFAAACGLTTQELYRTAIFLAYVHDIGKATTAFQNNISHNVPERRSILEHRGLALEVIIKHHFSHDLAGEAILRYYKYPKGIAAVVGAHHGVPTELSELGDRDLSMDKKDIIEYDGFYGLDGKNRAVLEKIWESIMDTAMNVSGISSKDEFPQLSAKAQLLLSGLIITSDWIASNTDYFPLISIDDTGDKDFYPHRIEKAWGNIEFPEKWTSRKNYFSEDDFKESFGFFPRETQKDMIDIVAKTVEPGIFILEAPMGIGKTEAALAAAELLAAKAKKKGLFFGLPTQATANGLFPRIMDWAEKQSDEFYHSIQLKHGSAVLNETFQKIQRGIPEDESDSGLIIHSWFCDNKKACLADFVVATVDQMLMLALKRRHVMLLHLGLSEKVVVIDEVHAYDAYMNKYLERALQWLGAYHTPVILLSATLPSKRRMSLVRAYLQATSSDSTFEENTSYPLLTWSDGNDIKQESLVYHGTHRTVKIQKCCNDDLFSLINNAVQVGACVGIIVNTVARAQNISDIVSSKITDNVLLYHAQYVMSDRNKKETELLERIGKHSNADTRKSLIVIGTQVLEQSLDIDFDILFTDICPMDLFLQRVGRLHRHERDYRSDGVKEPICYVITDEYEKQDSGSKRIYGEWLLKETLDFLPETLTLPDDISPLVQKVYNSFDDSEEYEKYKREIKQAESRAGSFLLKKAKCKDIHGFLDRSMDSTDSIAEASVRDGISSIEVLVMKRCSDGIISFLDSTELSPAPTEDEYKRIAEQRLRLPSLFSRKWN